MNSSLVFLREKRVHDESINGSLKNNCPVLLVVRCMVLKIVI